MDIVLRYVPSTWSKNSYSEVLYVREYVNYERVEFYNVVEDFNDNFANLNVGGIQRIQHPFAFGKYQIRKAQLQNGGYYPKEERMYLFITDNNKIDEILHYNCDPRRGGFSFDSRSVGVTGFILVVQVLDSNFDERDTHRYPEYLIHYRKSYGCINPSFSATSSKSISITPTQSIQLPLVTYSEPKPKDRLMNNTETKKIISFEELTSTDDDLPSTTPYWLLNLFAGLVEIFFSDNY